MYEAESNMKLYFSVLMYFDSLVYILITKMSKYGILIYVLGLFVQCMQLIYHKT